MMMIKRSNGANFKGKARLAPRVASSIVNVKPIICFSQNALKWGRKDLYIINSHREKSQSLFRYKNKDTASYFFGPLRTVREDQSPKKAGKARSFICLDFAIPHITLISFYRYVEHMMSMQPGQVIELRKGSYQVTEEIGYGASSKVYLVQRTREPKYAVHLLPTSSVQPSQHLEGFRGSSPEDVNPDLERLDQLVVENEAGRENLQSGGLGNYSSFSIENGKQNKGPPSLPSPQGQSQKDDKQNYFALKTVLIASEGLQSAKKEREYLTELSILSSLSHPGIIKLVDENIIVRGDKKELHLLAELGKGGNFLRFLNLIKEKEFTEQDMDSINRYYISQAIEIVDYLQGKGISHRDLKAENFILDQQYRLKLIDFGAAEVFHSERESEERVEQPLVNEKVDRNYIGTRHYISPEMIDRSRKTNRKDFYSKSDIWSVGVLIYYIVTHQYPFSGVNTYAIIENIKTREPNLSLIQNQHLRLLLFQMLRKDPNERVKVSQAKQSPYFQGVDFSKIFQTQSPFVRLMKEQAEDLTFREQLVIRINDQAKRRVVGLCKKQSSQRAVKKESILEKMNSFSNIDIKKNISENTEIHSQNKIESSNSIESPSTKRYLTIGKIGSAALPKQMELTTGTRLTVANKSCKLQWEIQEDGKSVYVDYPKQVEIKFESPEMLERFVQGFRRMQEDGEKY